MSTVQDNCYVGLKRYKIWHAYRAGGLTVYGVYGGIGNNETFCS